MKDRIEGGGRAGEAVRARIKNKEKLAWEFFSRVGDKCRIVYVCVFFSLYAAFCEWSILVHV